jgi:hypothetical protein
MHVIKVALLELNVMQLKKNTMNTYAIVLKNSIKCVGTEQKYFSEEWIYLNNFKICSSAIC